MKEILSHISTNPVVIFILEFISTFILVGVTEFFWAFYIHNLRDEKEHHAGLYCAGIAVFGGAGICLFVDNHWMLIASGLAAYFGTWISKFFYTKK